MNIVINSQAQEPIYEQIFQQIASQIINGRLAPNTCLPSIRSVARELNISIITIKNAWEKLENNGFIYTRAGKGCFVIDHSIARLDDKKIELARNQLEHDLQYYKGLGINCQDLIDLIKETFNKD